MHTKGSGCDLILHFIAECSERTAAVNKFRTFYEIIVLIQNIVWSSFFARLNLSGYFGIVFRSSFLFVCHSRRACLCFSYVYWDVYTHFSVLALTFLTPFGWLNTVLVSACRQYVNTLIALDQWQWNNLLCKFIRKMWRSKHGSGLQLSRCGGIILSGMSFTGFNVLGFFCQN